MLTIYFTCLTQSIFYLFQSSFLCLFNLFFFYFWNLFFTFFLRDFLIFFYRVLLISLCSLVILIGLFFNIFFFLYITFLLAFFISWNSIFIRFGFNYHVILSLSLFFSVLLFSLIVCLRHFSSSLLFEVGVWFRF